MTPALDVERVSPICLPVFGLQGVPARIVVGADDVRLYAARIAIYAKRGEIWLNFDLVDEMQSGSAIMRHTTRLSSVRDLREAGGSQRRHFMTRTVVEFASQRRPIDVAILQREQETFMIDVGADLWSDRVVDALG